MRLSDEQIQRMDWERKIYEQCAKEDLEELNHEDQ